MKKILKKEVIIAFIIGILLASSIAVYAYSYAAKDVSYTKPETTTATSVEAALNELYSKYGNYKNMEIRKIDNIISNSRDYTAQLDFSDVSNYQELTIDDFYVMPSTYTEIHINNSGSHGGLSTTKSYNNSTGKLTVTLHNEDNASYNGVSIKFPAVIAILGL